MLSPKANLVGIKQDRVLNTTIFVPGKTNPDIPVSCVEQGRWSNPKTTAKPESPNLIDAVEAKFLDQLSASAYCELPGEKFMVWDVGLKDVPAVLAEADRRLDVQALPLQGSLRLRRRGLGRIPMEIFKPDGDEVHLLRPAEEIVAASPTSWP